jgi:regulator of protease activity HflC (stomatin/prohibitin superfamily)
MSNYRAGNGKFVGKSNPVAVISALQSRVSAQREAEVRQQEAQRRVSAQRRGYRGPLTRDDLSGR